MNRSAFQFANSMNVSLCCFIVRQNADPIASVSTTHTIQIIKNSKELGRKFWKHLCLIIFSLMKKQTKNQPPHTTHFCVPASRFSKTLIVAVGFSLALSKTIVMSIWGKSHWCNEVLMVDCSWPAIGRQKLSWLLIGWRTWDSLFVLWPATHPSTSLASLGLAGHSIRTG